MRTWILALYAFLLVGGVTKAAPLVYTGRAISFSKQAGAEPLDPTNQDLLVPGVALTRGDTAGIFNAAVEESFTTNSSPAGTAWAFPFNNPETALSAAGWSGLVFADWQTAFGGAGSGGPPTTVNQDAVLHLIEQDVYLDIRFTAWGVGSGAGGTFAYERSEITPSADFDRDGDVDGRDFLIWQRGYGMAGLLQVEGDANFDGNIDADDLAVWQDSYGDPLLAISAVPEPGTWLLAGAAGLILGSRRANLSR